MTSLFGDFAGQCHGRIFYGAIGIQSKKGRSPFHVAVTNVATEVEQVWTLLLFISIFSSYFWIIFLGNLFYCSKI